MNSKFIKLIALLTVLCLLFSAFTGCGKKDDAADKGASSSAEVSESKTQQPTGSDGSKYAKVEVYEKEGAPHAQTDDGQEVELTGENLQKLIEEYQKVQGSGSEEERDLLNKIQLILEAPRE